MCDFYQYTIKLDSYEIHTITVADPGFPVRGGGMHPLGGGCRPPMQALFGENVCKNERIGSHRGGVHPARPLDPPMN